MPIEDLEALVAGIATASVPRIDDDGWAENMPPPKQAGKPLLVQQEFPALENVVCNRGEHVIENTVSRHGVARLRVMRLGRPVEQQLYMEQAAGSGAVGLQGWAWVDRSSGQEQHVALLVWKQE